ERAHAGVAPDDVGRIDRSLEIATGGAAQVLAFRRTSLWPRRIALVRHVGRADQRVALLVRDHEHHAPIVVLQYESVITIVRPGYYDGGALYQADVITRGLAQPLVEHCFSPRSRRIDDGSRGDLPLAISGLQPGAPESLCALRRDARGPGEHRRSTSDCISGVRHHQAGIVHAAIGIDEPAPELALKAGTIRRTGELHRVRTGQPRPAPQMIGSRQPGAEHPARPRLRRR